MSPEQLISALGRAYVMVLAAVLFALMLAETVRPLDAASIDGQRASHILHNFALWVVGLIVGNLIVGDWILGIPDWLLKPRRGLLADVSMPFPVLVVVGVVLGDVGEYAYHRLAHSNRWLWSLHAVHHADNRIDVSTALRFHPVEAAVNKAWKLGLFVVLGLPVWLVAVRALLLLPIALLQHANILIPDRVDRSIQLALVTPKLHKIHHSPLAEENNSNFGEIFTLWDRLFGTLHGTSADKDHKYGLSTRRDEYWQTVRGMLIMPMFNRRQPAP